MKPKAVDSGLLFAVLTLLGIGLVMVYSSSSVKAERIYEDGFYFIKRQALWAVIGVMVMIFFSNIPYWNWKRWATPMFWINVGLLVLVLVPGVSQEINGARRWIGFGPLSFQPSEPMKIAFVVYLAAVLAEAPERVRHFWRGLMPHLALLGLIFGLIMLEPDLGTALSISATVVLMLFAAGMRFAHMVGLGTAALPLVGLLIYIEPYRLRRLLSFVDPFADPQGSGYHIIQALYALGSGALFGAGLGRSRQKYFYLPEQHTDFIFAILGEELGFIGGAVVILLFVLFAWRGFMVAATAPDGFGALLAVGLTAMIVIQAAINIGVVTSSLPITGIPLPFLSYGGTSLVFTLAGLGVLLNVSRYSTR